LRLPLCDPLSFLQLWPADNVGSTLGKTTPVREEEESLLFYPPTFIPFSLPLPERVLAPVPVFSGRRPF